MAALSKLYSKKEIDAMREKLIAEHGDRCGICGKPGKSFKKKLAVDHSHKTGRIRGLLCYKCNRFILGRQTIESATAMLEYLLKYDKLVGE
jgi:hypothetical protein